MRILVAVVCLLLVLVLNIFHYKSVLYGGEESLAEYKTLEYKNLWYGATGAVLLFRAKRDDVPCVIVMPKDFSRENAELLARVFERIGNNPKSVLIMPDLMTDEKLKKFIQAFWPQVKIVDKGGDVVLSSELSSVQSIIYKNRLVPQAYSYNSVKKDQDEAGGLLDILFPLRLKPVSKIEKEKAALQAFWDDNKDKIYQIISGKEKLNIADKGLLLENVRFCVQISDDVVCNAAKGQSLLKNLNETLAYLSDRTAVKKLIFLTSDEEIEDIDNVVPKDDEGFYFRYKQRETYLLPQDIRLLTDKKGFGAILKLKTGINPSFTAPEMKFYKFKTVEGLIDENI